MLQCYNDLFMSGTDKGRKVVPARNGRLRLIYRVDGKKMDAGTVKDSPMYAA